MRGVLTQNEIAAFAGPFGGSSTSANEFYVSMFRNTIDYGIPASISVLINFGLNDKHIQYSADNLEHGCTMQQVSTIIGQLFSNLGCTKEFFSAQIWDPFAGVCRDVYCPAEFDLTSFTCLNPDGVNGSIYDEEPMTVRLFINCFFMH